MASTSINGFMCIFTLDRIDELRRFLTSFKEDNSLPISIFLARDIKDAHRIKTLCGFYSPFENTVLIDIDMLVNGNLMDLFSIAEQGKIGIVREKVMNVLNSGLIVFPKKLMQEVCSHWNKRFEKSVALVQDEIKGTWEQGLLNDLLKRFPFIELPFEYNCIIKDRTPGEELKIYDSVKIFHFLHEPGIDREKYKSYQEFLKL